jgi:flagellar protein FlaE/flagellar protein FlaC
MTLGVPVDVTLVDIAGSYHLTAAGSALVVLGVLDGILGSSSDGGTEGSEADSDGADLFDEPTDGDDGLADLGGDGDQLDGLGDGGGPGDGGGLDGSGGGDGAAPEVESRVDELESEVAELSSTMSTVRSENEAMAETVEDVEENVLKLLEIYEMVTRGVNPFVDGGTDDSGAAGGDFGLFENDTSGDADDGESSESFVESTETDDIFGDDAVEAGDGTGTEQLDGGEVETDAGGDLDDLGAGLDAEDGSSTTFDELKDEYDSEGEDWTDAAAENGESAGGDADGEVDDPGTDGAETAYLPRLPETYTAELVVLEWLTGLVERGGTRASLRAIDRYERMDWVGPAAAEQLRAVLLGLDDSGAGGALTREDHRRSLEYVARLGGDR